MDFGYSGYVISTGVIKKEIIGFLPNYWLSSCPSHCTLSCLYSGSQCVMLFASQCAERIKSLGGVDAWGDVKLLMQFV